MVVALSYFGFPAAWFLAASCLAGCQETLEIRLKMFPKDPPSGKWKS
jgi:hypothetical protein